MRTGKRGVTSGFTLVEMMVVLVALVLLAAAVVPALRGASHQVDLDGVAARVAASARFARETAAARGMTVALTVETAPEAVRLSLEEDATAPAAAALPTMAGRTGQAQDSSAWLPDRSASVLIPEGVTAHLEASPDTPAGAAFGQGDALLFPSDGRTEGGVIVLTDVRGRERRILVAPGTGRVETVNG